MDKLFRYELPVPVVKYLLQACESQQIRGLQQAKDLLQVEELLNSPLNADELEKETLETLKAKHEPLDKKKEKSK